MSRSVYTILFYLGLPLVLLRLLYRAWKAPAYAKRWQERFGLFQYPHKNRKSIWVHTVSVGESIAAAPLVKAMMARYPDHQFVVTTMTPTGSEQVKKIYGDSVFHVYAPYDLPDAVCRFLNKVRPELAVFMETELWPNTIAGCHKRNIPTLLTNARLSERSARGYQRVAGISRPMLQQVAMIAAQGADDARRFEALGYPKERLVVTGTLKYDLSVAPQLVAEGQALRKTWLEGRSPHARIFIAASTHKGEDQQVISAFRQLRNTLPDTLLILVPRHPERFQPVYELLNSENLTVSRRSIGEPVTADTHVLLGDTMGELMRLFATADVAFIGGSLAETGGHNPLEPAALSLPVLMGPHLFNFQEVTDTLKAAGALTIVHNSAELARSTEQLLTDKGAWQQNSQAATAVMQKNRGALERQLTLAEQLITGC